MRRVRSGAASPREVFMGVDLAATPRRSSAVCLLSPSGDAALREARLDEEIVDVARISRPLCVAIDAPLSFPSGAAGPRSRLCDVEVRRMGIRIFPVMFGFMRLLTERGVGLAAKLRGLGLEVLETFPSGAQRLLGLWMGGERRPEPISSGLRRLGVKLPRRLSLDMVDAATCAYVALLHTRGLSISLGEPSEGLIILPSKSIRLSAPRRSSYRSRRGSRRSRPS